MAPVEERLRELLAATSGSRVLENTRFDPGETTNDPGFARELADGATSTSTTRSARPTARTPRPRASRTCCPPTPACCSSRARGARPAARRGRAAVRPRRPAARRSRTRSASCATSAGGRTRVLVGGKMAEELRAGNPLDFEVELPVDVVAAAAFEPDAEAQVVAVDDVPGGLARPRHRPGDARAIRPRDREAQTIFWNGPMGVFEWPRFAEGTKAVAEAVADATAYSVVGGADSVRALNELGLADRDLLGLDRRRRVARAARGQGAARRGGDPGRRMADADRRQLEDVQGPAETRRSARARAADLDGVDASSARRTSRLRDCGRAPGRHDRTRRTSTGSRRARSPARSPRRCCSSSASPARSSATRSAGSTSARRTRRSRSARAPRSTPACA